MVFHFPNLNQISFHLTPHTVLVIRCNGLGEVTEVDINKILPDTNLSVKKGGIAPLGKYQENWVFKQVEVILINAGHNLTTPLKDISEEILQ